MRLPCRFLVLASLVAAGLGRSPLASAEDNNANRELAAVRAAAKEYVAALDRGDAEVLGKMWSADGDYVDAAGQTFKASEIIGQQAGAKSPERKFKSASIPESTLRFITPDVAIEDGVTGGGATSDGESIAGRFTAVWVQRDGRWLLDSLRESATVSPAAEDHLQSLNWLIGEWAGKSDGSSILISSRRSTDGPFIVREFVDRDKSGSMVTGTQRIWWDETTGNFKCWAFDSLGGISDGIWRGDGNRWIVETTEVMPGGRKLTSTSVYVPGEDGRFVWEATGSKVGRENVPARRVEFKRAAEK